jgi:hypothetical protein
MFGIIKLAIDIHADISRIGFEGYGSGKKNARDKSKRYPRACKTTKGAVTKSSVSVQKYFSLNFFHTLLLY